MKKRTLAIVFLAAASAAAAAVAYGVGIDPPVVNVAGSFAIIAVVLVLSKLIKIPDNLFYTGLIFIFCASPIGSVIDLYRLWGPYDKIVHFASGLLLAAAAYSVISWLLAKAEIEAGQPGVLLICIFFAFLFSSAGAGIWEIFEFVADKVAGGGMQRGMVDTVTDMIAGNIGALCYGGYLWITKRR